MSISTPLGYVLVVYLGADQYAVRGPDDRVVPMFDIALDAELQAELYPGSVVEPVYPSKCPICDRVWFPSMFESAAYAGSGCDLDSCEPWEDCA